MKIKTKLATSSVIILLLMAGIGASAIIGIQYIQKNIFQLTQKSTPYQTKTFNHQRALQAHAANLLKVAASDSPEEFKRNAAQSDESLAEEMKAADELTKLGSASDYQHELFAATTKSIRELTGKRLDLQRETWTTVAAMRNSLLDSSRRLQDLDSSIRRLQKGASEKMVSNIAVNASGSNQTIYLTSSRDLLKDTSIFLSRLTGMTAKEKVDAAWDKNAEALNNLVSSVKMVQWSEGRAGIEWGEKAYELTDRIAEAKDLYLKFLETGDSSVRGRALQAIRAADGEVAALLAAANGEAEKSAITQDQTATEMMTSVAGASASNNILALSSELILSSAVIDSQINYSLSVKNQAEFGKAISIIEREFARVEGTAGKLNALLAKGRFKAQTRQLADAQTALKGVRNGYLGKGGVAEKILASLKNVEAVARLNQAMKEMVDRQMRLSGRDVAAARQSQEGAVLSVRSAVKTTTVVIVIIAAVAVLASVLLSGWIASSITAPIDELTRMAEGFGTGNFGIRLDESRRDEFGTLARHFNQATAKLAEITRLLKSSIGSLTDGSGNLSRTADALHLGAQEQAAQTMHSSVAMTQISATVEAVAEHANNAAASSRESHTIATEGKEVVERSVKGMREISASVIAAATTIERLSENSERIGSILATINDIADQTNLLALNAAIEAARAGEHGAGFAVVADEVRKLARRTSDATREIEEIVSAIQAGTKESVQAMNVGKSRVEEGMKLSAEASRSLQAIVGVSQGVVDMAQMIATATTDQSKASRDVSQSMELIATITGTLKNSTEEIKGASLQLANIAGELNQMACWFNA